MRKKTEVSEEDAMRDPDAKDFLRRKWDRELQYVLRKYLWAFHDNRIAVCFEYEAGVVVGAHPT